MAEPPLDRDELLGRDSPLVEHLLHAYARRYGCPVMITETAALGSPARRIRWLDASVEAVRRLRARRAGRRVHLVADVRARREVRVGGLREAAREHPLELAEDAAAGDREHAELREQGGRRRELGRACDLALGA